MIKEIAIIGSGVVGQATGKGFIKKGYRVVFSDIDYKVINKLQKEGFESIHIKELRKRAPDLFFICIQIPTAKNGPQVKLLERVLKDISFNLKEVNKYSLVSIRSTVPPLTAKNLAIPLLQKFSGKKFGKDFGFCSNPEYLRERFAEKDFLKPRVIIIGSEDKKSAKVLSSLYKKSFPAPIFHFKTAEAEMHKYVHNLYNATKISFFNEQREILQKLELNSDKIFQAVSKSAEAFWNPKYGIKNKGAFDGSCLPKDAEGFLRWSSSRLKKNLPLLESVIKVNNKLKKLV